MIKILRRDNHEQLQLFRRLEQSSKKLINSRCALEFLELCQSFALTPTFAKVSNPKATRWKKSAKGFEETVVKEEILQKKTQIKTHRKEVIDIYEEIKKKSSTLRYICTLHVTNMPNKNLYQCVMTIHPRKISRMLSRATNVAEHIENISSSWPEIKDIIYSISLLICISLRNMAPTVYSRILYLKLKLSNQEA